MKLFQLNKIKTDALSAFRRFPLFMIFCITLSLVSIFTIEYGKGLDWNTRLNIYHFLSILSMGILFILTLTNYTEKVKLLPLKFWIIQGLAIIFMVFYYLITPQQFSTFELTMRIISINLGLAFLLIYLPYHMDNDLSAFWVYTKTLFLRLMTTYLFTMILYIGLSLAMLAIEKLFGVHIKGELYLYLLIVLSGIFAPVFFAGGLSNDYSYYAQPSTYPKALKFLVLYIILPIVVIYMTILYVYAFKIIVLWHLPSGWVSNLVLSFSIAGLISFFFIYPLKNSENKFITGFFKLYFWLMLPLIALLFIAIFKRVGEYGITELRYYVMLLAFWLAFISIYLIITKYKNIKIIALSFFIIAVLSSFGPWGAFSVSERSQLKCFEKILTKNNMLKNGLIIKNDTVSNKKVRRDLSSIVTYIVEYHNEKDLQKYFTVKFDTLFKKEDSRYNKPEKILKLMGVEYVNRWDVRYDEENNDYNEYINFNADLNENIIDISKHDFLINVNGSYYRYPESNPDSIIKKEYKNDNLTITEAFNLKNNNLSYLLGNYKINILSINLNDVFTKLIKDYPAKSNRTVLPEKLHFGNTSDIFKADFQILYLSANSSSKGVYNNISLTARLMVATGRNNIKIAN